VSTKKLLAVYLIIGLVIGLPFTIIHLTAKPDKPVYMQMEVHAR
jgi:hypothetical protein